MCQPRLLNRYWYVCLQYCTKLSRIKKHFQSIKCSFCEQEVSVKLTRVCLQWQDSAWINSIWPCVFHVSKHYLHTGSIFHWLWAWQWLAWGASGGWNLLNRVLSGHVLVTTQQHQTDWLRKGINNIILTRQILTGNKHFRWATRIGIIDDWYKHHCQ